MISDGFGGAGETFARQYYSWKEKQSMNFVFPLDKIIVGSIRTRSSSHLITDSAAGGTAFSCALKTYNGAIGGKFLKKSSQIKHYINESFSAS
jgi:alkaline phosphatase